MYVYIPIGCRPLLSLPIIRFLASQYFAPNTGISSVKKYHLGTVKCHDRNITTISLQVNQILVIYLFMTNNNRCWKT